MRPEEQLEILYKMIDIDQKGIENREKKVELISKLAQNPNDDSINTEINRVEKEYQKLFSENKELLNKLLNQ